MSLSRRLFLLTIACLSLSSALALLAYAGLPERASYSGLITDNGLFAPEIAALAPTFRAETARGDIVDLLNLRGSPVIINFWATWCAPCVVEMPELQTIYEARQAEGLHVLAVNLGETVNAVSQWSQAYGLTYDLLLDPQGEIATLYRLRGQPSTYVVSPEGVVTAIFYGPVSADQLEAALVPLL